MCRPSIYKLSSKLGPDHWLTGAPVAGLTILWQNIGVPSAFPDPGIILVSTVCFHYKQLPGSPLSQAGVTSSQWWGAVLPGFHT